MDINILPAANALAAKVQKVSDALAILNNLSIVQDEITVHGPNIESITDMVSVCAKLQPLLAGFESEPGLQGAYLSFQTNINGALQVIKTSLEAQIEAL